MKMLGFTLLTQSGFDKILFVMTVVIIVIIYYSLNVPKNYVPDAVKGMTSIIGILTGFTAILLQNKISNTDNPEKKKWLHHKLLTTGIFLVFQCFLLFISYALLTRDNLFEALRWITISLMSSFMMFLRAMVISALEEEQMK